MHVLGVGGHEGIDLSQLSRYLGCEHPAGCSQHGQAHGGGNECGPKAAVALEISPWETGLASAYCWISRRGETRESHMESSAFSFPVRGQNGEGGWARGWGGARAGRGCLTFGARWHQIVDLSYFAQREGEHASDRHHPHRIGST